jgi:PilZ domain
LSACARVGQDGGVKDSTPPPIAGRAGPAPLPGVGPVAPAPSGSEASAVRLTPPEGGPRLSPGEEERRRHPRAPVDLLVGVKFESVQQFLAVYAEDLSESGMFLRSEHAGPLREVGQTVELRFDAGNRRIVEGRARVVRVLEPSSPGAPGGIAIEFIDLDPVSRKLIEAIVRIKLAAVHGG